MMVSEPGLAAAGTEAEPWKGLAPSSLLINLLPDLWRTVRGLWWVIPAMWASGSIQSAMDLSFLLFFFGLSVSRTVARYLSLRYRTHAGRLELTDGIVFRQHRTIDPARVQHMEITRNLLHRLTGLVELRIDTAGESGSEGQLSGLPEAEARRLQRFLSRTASPPASPGLKPSTPDLRTSALELIGYGLSIGRVGAALVAGTLLMEYLAVLSPRTFGGALSQLSPPLLAGFLLIGTVASFGLSAGSALVRFYGLQLTRTARGIQVEAGLFTRTSVEIPRDKVQLVRVTEPWLRRLLGFGSLHVETAGSVLPDEAGVASEASLPMVETQALHWATTLVIPGLDVDPWSAPLRPAAPRALVRALARALLRWTGISALIAWQTGSPLAMLLLLPGLLLAAWDWRRQGWLVTPHAIIVRSGIFERRTVLLDRNKIQSVHLRQGLLMRLAGLARVSVWVAGASVTLPELTEEECNQIFEGLVK